jgi:ethanolamine utilization protein EutN
MQRARVVGRATATVKHPSLERQKLLIVQPLMNDGVTPDGTPIIVIDQLGAGRNDEVIITSDGRLVRESLNSKQTPVRWSTLGVRD